MPPIPFELPPPPSSSPLAVRLQPPAERAVRSGHPWVFEGGIRSVSRTGEAGDIAVLFDRKNRFLAVGLFDPSSPIRIRVLQEGEPARVGGELLRSRVAGALERRSALAADPATTGYRVVHGEGDGLPGLVLDRYGGAAVLKLYTPAWLPWLVALVEAVGELLEPDPLVGLVSRRMAADPSCPQPLRTGALLLGEGKPGPLPFLESDLEFEAHPLEGHKTGFYLDQRENRRRLELRAGGTRVLNVFSYSGGFSLYAARGGAVEVTSLDRSGPALAQAERHFELNRHRHPHTAAGTGHQTLEGDAFQILERLGRAGERFDVVVVDPPSFAKEKGQVSGALKAYAALTRLGLGVLEDGGLLVQASCSSRVAATDFFHHVLQSARRAGRPLTEEERTGHPPDHPVGFPEGAYLKCLFARG